eukprot:gene16111-17012_t
MECDDDAPATPGAAPIPPPDPPALRAAYLFASSRAPERWGARTGDWVIYDLPPDEVAVQQSAIKRIRSRAHAEVIFMRQWHHQVRVSGAALAPSLWGGNDLATIEVSPAGTAQAREYLLAPRDWIANVGTETAYVQLKPRTARRPPPEYFLELPPQTKAVILTSGEGQGWKLAAHRAAGEPWLPDGPLLRPNVDESTLVWYTASPPDVCMPAAPRAARGCPRVGCINVAGTVGGGHGAQRLRELADCAEHYNLGILFAVSCGRRRRDITRLEGRPWRVIWSVDGGSPQEGVCALIHDSVSITGSRSEHHDVLGITIPPRAAPGGTRTLRDTLLLGCYAVGTPLLAGQHAVDERWPESMRAVGTAIQRHVGPKIALGDWNARDPELLLRLDSMTGGHLDIDAFQPHLDVLGLTVAPLVHDLPTWLGAGESGVRARRIDHILYSSEAEALEIVAEVIWCLRWVVDHALILTDLQGGPETLPEPHVWRSVTYNTRDPESLLEFAMASTVFSRHITASDSVAVFDAALRRAAHAALCKQQTCRVTPSVTANDAGGMQGNLIAEWIAARAAGHMVEHLDIDDTLPLVPTNDAAEDARRAFNAFRDRRTAARERLAVERHERRAKHHAWQQECMASDRGTTQRLMRKPGLTVISIVENADGSAATGSALPQAVWEQSRAMREDAQLREETRRFLRNFEGDRVGPVLSEREASGLLWGLRSSAPGIDQISARMLRHAEAWAPEVWL